MLSLAHALAVLSLAASAHSSPAAFVPVKLPHGVQLELPAGWEAHARNQRVDLAEVSGFFDATLNRDFTANHYDATGQLAASVHVGYYRDLDLTQADARRAGQQDVVALDAFLRGSMEETGRASGYAILSWRGTERRDINGVTAFVSDYSRSLLRQPDSFRVRLVRVFDGPRSFTLSVSYRESARHQLQPLCDRIIASLASSTPAVLPRDFSGLVGY